MTDINAIPQGFKKDGKGNLVALANIKQTDLIRDEFVYKAIAQAKKMQLELAQFKENQMSEADEFIELLAQEHDVKLGGKKGNITLRSFDHKLKVTLQNQERIELGPQLIIAKQLIDECLETWTQDGNQNIQIIVNNVFNTDKEGTINPQRILSLRKYEITDNSGKWQKAMDLIAESVDVVDSCRFIRFYETDENGKEQPISLDIAKL
ncbi:DUF3164 family protein [Pseudoalteromonas denitrificans]|uniref:Sulfate transporter n=1 Tax=Pseudoalteromonas denitrificans DSM 6059 TaxID=1123010 RepID=A0A1I1FYL0_9GAMM|nr:DUF3164 family protein [Pseudoalteromonas denitrificans]SFC04679.1 Protein of unknown function [Pseudoalteromonas denitrificans DSM 6059]